MWAVCVGFEPDSKATSIYIFGRFYNFLSFMSAQVLWSAQNPLEICLNGNC